MAGFLGIRLTLGRKILASFLILGACIVGGSFTTLNLSLLPIFEEFENQQATENLSRFKKSIDRELSALALLSTEYSEWDHTHEFMLGERPEYAAENLNIDFFPNLQVNLMLLIDLQGNLVWGKITDDDHKIELSIDEELKQPLQFGHPLLPGDHSTGQVMGILQTRSGLVLVVSSPILQSLGVGQSAGRLLLGRYLNDERLADIARQTELRLSLERMSGSNSISGLGSQSESAESKPESPQWEYGDELLSAKDTLQDVFGSPAAILTVQMPRNVTRIGKQTISSALLFLSIGGAILVFVAWCIMQRLVVKPVLRLKGQVSRFRDTGELVRDSDDIRDDEIGVLTREFHSMTAARRKAQDELLRLAFYDELTGLPNRRLFGEHVEKSILRGKRQNEISAMCIVDLDGFKTVNDTLGHSIGDLLLRMVSDRLAGVVRSDDAITAASPSRTSGAEDHAKGDAGNKVARIGGDEFLILLTDLRDSDAPAMVVNRLLKEIAQPFNVEGHELNLTASVGIALYPEDGDSLEILMRHADSAMYDAKRSGKNNFVYYQKAHEKTALRRLTLEAMLRKALENSEFELHYQPQIDMRSGNIFGVEGLLRWFQSDQGMISPGEFIPIAEDTGLINPIGEWVLHESIKQIQIWRDLLPDDFKVSVNISGIQLRRDNFLVRTGDLLRDAGSDGSNLVLELTESALMSSAESSVALLRELKEFGLELAIDDFGTGYSSLSYLKKFPIDYLKIDRSFVLDLESNEDDVAIVGTIYSMARTLGLKVVAEGVETEQQLQLLRQHGDGLMQGYLFSPALSATEFEAFYKNYSVDQRIAFS